MLLRLTKIYRKMTGIYAPILLHDLDCRPGGGGSQKDRASMPPRAVPAQEQDTYRMKLQERDWDVGQRLGLTSADTPPQFLARCKRLTAV
jgi:hypothetical protein